MKTLNPEDTPEESMLIGDYISEDTKFNASPYIQTPLEHSQEPLQEVSSDLATNIAKTPLKALQEALRSFWGIFHKDHSSP